MYLSLDLTSSSAPKLANALANVAPNKKVRADGLKLLLWLLQVQEKLPEAGNPALRGKLQNLLAEAAKGVGQNPSATPGQILDFCRGVLDDAVAEQRRQAQAAKRAGMLGAPEATRPAAGSYSPICQLSHVSMSRGVQGQCLGAWSMG